MNSVYQVARGVWQVRLAWTQVYVLSEGGSFFLVDTGTRRDRIRLLAALRQIGLHSRDCRGVLLTHGHCDHAGNAAFFAQRGAPCAAHAAEAKFLETRRPYLRAALRALTPQGLMFLGGEVVFPVRRFRLTTLLHDGDVVSTPAGHWRVLHTPGHTPGHVSLFRESDGVLLSGDALLNIVPFASRSGLSLPHPLFNWDNAPVLASAERLAALRPSVLLPGHGPAITEQTAARILEFLFSC